MSQEPECFYCKAIDKPLTFTLTGDSSVTLEGQTLKGNMCVDCFNRFQQGDLKL